MLRLLFADCEVYYDGRANSELARGNYLIIYKADCSLSIHASTDISPRNYQGAGCELIITDTEIIAKRKNEMIRIVIINTIWKHELENWSDNKIKITMTEAELVQKIISDPIKYFGFEHGDIRTEYPTAAGPIDIAAFYMGRVWIVEVKRKRVSLNNCIQLKKYLDHLMLVGYQIIPCMAGPEISPKALKYCQEHNYRWIEVGFNSKSTA